MHYYDPMDWRNRIVRWGKYLIPWGAFLPMGSTVKAPREFVSLTDSTSIPLSHSPPLEKGEVDAIQDGCWTRLPLSGIPEWDSKLFVLPDGISVGRNCLLIENSGQAVRETAFFHKWGVRGAKRYLWIDPRYWKHRRRGNLTARSQIPAPQKLVGTAMALNNVSCQNYYHWVLEIAPRVVGAMQQSIPIDYYIVDHLNEYQRSILTSLGTRPEQWVQPHCNLSLTADQMVWSNEPNFELVRSFVDRIAASLPEPNSRNLRIYITRGVANRSLVNEQALIDALSAEGFETYDFGKIPFAKQVDLIRSASHIVSVHGAALANTIFAQSGTCVIEIVPKRRANYDLYPNQSRRFGARHTLVLAESSKRRQRLLVNVGAVLSAVNHSDS